MKRTARQEFVPPAIGLGLAMVLSACATLGLFRAPSGLRTTPVGKRAAFATCSPPTPSEKKVSSLFPPMMSETGGSTVPHGLETIRFSDTVTGVDAKKKPDDGHCIDAKEGSAASETACNVRLAAGSFAYQATPLSFPQLNHPPFGLTLSYSTPNPDTRGPRALDQSSVGEGWVENINQKLTTSESGNELILRDGYPGTLLVYTRIPEIQMPKKGYIWVSGGYSYVITRVEGAVAYADNVDAESGTTRTFVLANRLLDTVTYSDGTALTYYYREFDLAPGKRDCEVSSIQDARGNVFTFDYTVLNLMSDPAPGAPAAPAPVLRMTGFSTPDGLSVGLDYYKDDQPGVGEKGALKAVRGVVVTRGPAGHATLPSTTTFHYTGRMDYGGLETVTRPGENQPFIATKYSGQPGTPGFGRVAAQRCGPGTYTFSYDAPLSPLACARPVTAIDPVGNKIKYDISPIGFVKAITRYTARFRPDGSLLALRRPVGAGPGQQPESYQESWAYDEFGDGRVIRGDHADGSATESSYHAPKVDNQSPPRTTVQEWSRRFLLESRTEYPDPAAQAPAGSTLAFSKAPLTWRYEYADPCFNQLTRQIGPTGLATTTRYDQGYSDLNGNGDCDGILESKPRFGPIAKFYPNVTAPTPQKTVESWTYNSSGQVRAHVDTRGITTQFDYDGPRGNGYLAKTTVDAGGLNLVTQRVSDLRGNGIREIDPDGVISESEFDEMDRRYLSYPAKSVASGGQGGAARPDIFTETYFDALGRPSQVNRSTGATSYPDYPGTPFPSGPQRLSTWFEYTALGKIARLHQETGVPGGSPGVMTYVNAYDDLGNLLFTRLPSGKIISRSTYDALNRVIEKEELDGTTVVSRISTDYRADSGAAVRVRDLAGHQAETVYDGFGRLYGPRSATDALTPSSYRERAYDALGRVVEERAFGSADGTPGSSPRMLSRMRHVYDELGREWRTERQLFDRQAGPSSSSPWVASEVHYQAGGLVKETVDARGNRISNSYDTAGRLIETRLPNGEKNEISYSPAGLTRSNKTTEMPSGEVFVTRSFYDSAGHLEKAVDNLGGTSTQSTDALGNVIRTVDAMGNVTESVFDAQSRPVRRTTRMNGALDSPATGGDLVVETAYDADGLATDSFVGKVLADTQLYDGANRLSGKKYADGTMESTTYDAAGNASVLALRDGTRIRLAYDARNQLVSKTVIGSSGVGSRRQEFRTDGEGLGVYSSDDNGNAADQWARTARYDSLGRVSSATETLGGSAPLTTQAGYDPNGNMISLTYPSGGTLNYSYTSANMVSTVQESANGQSLPLAQFDYKSAIRTKAIYYPSAANPVAQTEVDFDGLNRVAALRHVVAGTPMATFRYSYDKNSNVLSRDASIRVPSAVIESSRTLYSYDPANELRQKAVQQTGSGGAITPAAGGESFKLDGRGNDEKQHPNSLNQPTLLGGEAAVWDRNGLLQSKGAHRYAFDAFGRLRQFDGVTLLYDSEGRTVARRSGGELKRYVYFQGRLLETRTGSQQVTTYALGNGPDQVLRMRRAVLSGPLAGTADYTFFRDGTGSTVAVSQAGALQQAFQYKAYGEPAVLDAQGAPLPASSAIAQDHLFAGRRYDADLQGYDHWRRYRLKDGPFVGPDPSGLLEHTLYAYASGNPVIKMDASGLGDAEDIEAALKRHEAALQEVERVRARLQTAIDKAERAGLIEKGSAKVVDVISNRNMGATGGHCEGPLKPIEVSARAWVSDPALQHLYPEPEDLFKHELGHYLGIPGGGENENVATDIGKKAFDAFTEKDPVKPAAATPAELAGKSEAAKPTANTGEADGMKANGALVGAVAVAGAGLAVSESIQNVKTGRETLGEAVVKNVAGFVVGGEVLDGVAAIPVVGPPAALAIGVGTATGGAVTVIGNELIQRDSNLNAEADAAQQNRNAAALDQARNDKVLNDPRVKSGQLVPPANLFTGTARDNWLRSMKVEP